MLQPGTTINVADQLTRFLPRLHAFIRLKASRRLLQRESTSDLLQSVCCEALQAKGTLRFESDDHFARWLCAIAMSKLVDRHRHAAARKRPPVEARSQLALSPADEAQLPLGYHDLLTPSAHASHREQVARLERAIEGLSDEHREIIGLARIMQLPHAETARITGRSEAAVRQMLSRAMARLGALLSQPSVGMTPEVGLPNEERHAPDG